jgi:dihydropteroate synthase
LAPKPGEVSAAVASAKLQALRQHLPEYEWRMGKSAERWYVRAPELRPTSPHGTAWVNGRSVTPFVSREPAARPWRLLFNDAQMVLHAAETAAADKADGAPPLNALWLWGSGDFARGAAPAPFCVGNDVLLAGAARAAGGRWTAALRCEEVLAEVRQRDVVLMVDAPWGAALPEVLLSIDTFRAPVAAAALAAGADWLNDVSGGRLDPELLSVAAAWGCPLVLMHSRGNSRSMDGLTAYGNLVDEVIGELQEASGRARAAGVAANQLIWDPGLGFAKTEAQSLALLDGLERMRAQGYPLLVGPSRKRFIGAVLNEPRPRARLWGTAAVVCKAIAAGADIVRVHDVGPIVQTARMADALWRKPAGSPS